MKQLMLAATVMTFIAITPLLTQGQTCCGQPEAIMVNCPSNCGTMVYYDCNAYAAEDWMVIAHVQCGSFGYCGSNATWAIAGYCSDDAAIRSQALGELADPEAETTPYENAYVRDCHGDYVALRLAIERPVG